MKQWKIITTHPNYEISNCGDIRNKTTGRVKHKTPNQYGYVSVTLFNKGKGTTYVVHRLVAEYFISNPDNKELVNHINAIRHDNSVENLEWCTPSENMQHMVAIGNNKDHTGINNPMSKFTDEDIINIRKDPRTNKEIANSYNVSIRAITNIKSGKTYRESGGPIKQTKYNRTYSEQDILDIRHSTKSDEDLAQIYFCDKSNIARIRLGDTYKCFGGPLRSRDNKPATPKGEACKLSTITAEIAKDIKYNHKGESAMQIATALSVSKHIVYNILQGRTWKHI